MVPLTRDELLEVGAAEELLRHQVVATHGWLLDRNRCMFATTAC